MLFLRSLFFWLNFIRKRFAEALAWLDDRSSLNGKAGRVWAKYRLGLYGAVVISPRDIIRWKGTFARSVSLAAFGRHKEAEELAWKAVKRYGMRRDVHALPDALAPFLPKLALEIIEGYPAPVSLRAALLQKNGKRESSEKLLCEAFRKGMQQNNPELYLYLSNTRPWDNRKRLEYLNRFLASRELPPVDLINATHPPSPQNLMLAIELPKASRSPLVSILMTTYQSSDHVDKAIASVLSQTWRNIELIIIDDASTDKTPEQIALWAQKDSRIRLVTLPRNVGTYAAKNIGLRYATGEFVTCHDADDWSHPLKIERQVTPLLKSRKLICTTSDWIRMQDNGTYYARPVHPLQRFNPSSPLFRRKEVLETTGAWDCVRTGADSEFAARLKIVFGRKAVLRIRQPLAFGSHRPGSLMTDAATGYTSGRVPPDRLDYWESWTYWHINELRKKRKPRMPGLLEERPYNAPPSIRVRKKDIAANLEHLQRLPQ